MRALTRLLAMLAVLTAVASSMAQEPAPPEETVRLPPVVVVTPPAATTSSDVVIPRRDLDLRPEGRPADILRLIPGFVVGQHQGGGKAEQYFLRGFDADHGTDVLLSVDGVPVNLRSHAHGQGYADLHFLIPETVERVEASKGPYRADLGDFVTAGAVNFVTRDTVPENTVQASGGSFNTQRYLTLLSPTREGVKSLIAVEGYFTDGPFVHPTNYERFSAFAKVSGTVMPGLDLALWASHYRGSWDGSGQIPLRAVRDGSLDRFGAVDPTEGGETQRTIVNGTARWRASGADVATVQAYAQYEQLNLFNNFTFFLNDPVNGDGIRQYDRRWVAGADARWEHTFDGLPLVVTPGLQYRLDTPRVVLADETARRDRERTVDADIVEYSVSPFLKLELTPASWLRLVAGARGDFFVYDVHDNLGRELRGRAAREIGTYKGNAVLGPWERTEFFANVGTGFHSNDARAVIQDRGGVALPEARGWELGLRTRLVPRVELSVTYWSLKLQSELVFVGDEGTTEARGPSTRHGWEVAGRAQLLDWLELVGDVTISRARFDNGDEVPLAPRLTSRGELIARLGGLAASAGLRYLGDRYATEDRQQTARGYLLVGASARYRLRQVEAFVTLENLTGATWRESQSFFTSRLPGEPVAGVPDLHFTPGAPRSVLGGLAIHF
jgi:outer membrane receptor protein involved in Fe transport